MSEKIIKKHSSNPGAEFEDLNMAGSTFTNIDLSNAKFHDINFSNVSISAANFSGVKLIHIGPAPDEKCQHPKQGPPSFWHPRLPTLLLVKYCTSMGE